MYTGVGDMYLHIGVVDEGPSPRSFQDVVQEVLQPSVESISFRRFLSSGDAAALSSRTLFSTWAHRHRFTDVILRLQ